MLLLVKVVAFIFIVIKLNTIMQYETDKCSSFEEYLDNLSEQDAKDYIEENKADILLSSMEYQDEYFL